MNKPEEETEDEPLNQLEDYFAREIDLLIMLILLEDFEGRQMKLFRLNAFWKGNYWTYESFNENLPDEEFWSMEDRFFSEVELVLEDSKMGKLTEAGIMDTNDALIKIIKEIGTGRKFDGAEWEHYYLQTIEQIYFLTNQRDNHFDNILEKAKSEEFMDILKEKNSKNISFTKDIGYFEKLQQIMITVPSEILIYVKYNEKICNEIRKKLDKFILDFSEGKEHSELTVTVHFEKQLDNFFRYVNNLKPVGQYADIPFDALKEKDFEVVKILRYLQVRNLITISWADDAQWKVKFLQMPISLDLVFPTEKELAVIDNKQEQLKSDLSFEPILSVLNFHGKKIKITGSEQKVFLKIIFGNPENLKHQMFFSEIAEMYDASDMIDDKKFYNVAYNLNKRILLETGIKDLFVLTKQTLQINPKYL